MKKSVKVLLLFTIALLMSEHVPAQSKLIAANNLMSDVKKIIDDFPNCFANITGEIIIKNPQSTEFECSIRVDGAEKTTVTVYASKTNSSCSWQGCYEQLDILGRR